MDEFFFLIFFQIFMISDARFVAKSFFVFVYFLNSVDVLAGTIR